MRINTDRESKRMWIWFGENNITFEVGKPLPLDLGFRINIQTEDVTLGLYLFLIDFYISLDFKSIRKFLSSHPNYFFKCTWEKGSPEGSYWQERGIGLSLNLRQKTLSGEFWTDMNNHPTNRHFYIFLDNLILGRHKLNKTLLKEGEAVINMPEGDYPCTYKVESWVWSRSRFPFLKKKRVDVSFDIPWGVPEEGKGENSWDCGMDAVFGTGVAWKGDIHQAIKDLTLNLVKGRLRTGPLMSEGYTKWRNEQLLTQSPQKEK